MAASVASPKPIKTLAELLKRLGGVPPRRVLLHPPPGTATEADVLAALEEPRKRICELVEGVLVEKAMGYRESGLAAFLIGVLNAFVIPKNLGIVTGADGTVRLAAGLVRIPDVAFTSWGRLPNRRYPKDPIPGLAPDLAAEVLSRGNTKAEMKRKREDYFNAKVRLVWLINPRKRTVAVYTAVDVVTVLTEADTLDGGAVLPGFRLPLRDLFAELDRQG